MGYPLSTVSGTIPAKANANDYIQTGIYALYGEVSGLAANAYGFLIIINNSQTTLQIHVSSTNMGGSTLLRQKFKDGEWTVWKNISA